MNANLRLVTSRAKGFAQNNTGILTFHDLCQEGAAGLLIAIERFDPDLISERTKETIKFSTFSVPWIDQKMQRAIANTCSTIRIPVHVHELIPKIKKALDELRTQLQREPTTEEISQASGIPAKKIPLVQTANSMRITTSLEGSLTEEGDTQFSQIVADPTVDVEGEAQYTDLRLILIKEFKRRLSTKQANVLIMRFGLNGDGQRTIEEVSRALGVTRKKVRQIEAKALRRLNTVKLRRRIKEFIE